MSDSTQVVPSSIKSASFPLRGANAGNGTPGTVVTVTDATEKDLTETGPVAGDSRVGYLEGLRLVWTVVGAAAGVIEIYDQDSAAGGVLVASIVVGEAAPAVGKVIDIKFSTPRRTQSASAPFRIKGYANVGTVKVTVDGYYWL